MIPHTGLKTGDKFMRLARVANGLRPVRTPDYDALLPRMLQILDEANGTNPHYLGWARHSYNDYLKAAP